MEFKEINGVNLVDICVVPDSDTKKFNTAEKEISKIIKKKVMITKSQKDKAFKNIEAYFRVVSIIYINNSSNKDDAQLSIRYKNLMETIRKKFGSVPKFNFSVIPINVIKLNYNESVFNYNNIIKDINSLPNEAKKIAPQRKKITTIVSMLFSGIRGTENLYSSKKSAWDIRLSQTKKLLLESQKFLKIAKEEIEILKNIAKHKKLLSQFNNNPVEYRKWWVLYFISTIKKIPSELKIQLIDFNPKNLSSINSKTIKKVISSLSYTSIKFLIDNMITINIPFNFVFIIKKADPYFGNSIINNIDSELKAFKIPTQSLLKDLKNELEKKKIFIKSDLESDISKIKPTNDVIENILDVLKKCLKNPKDPFPNSLSNTLKKYVAGQSEGTISHHDINGVLRNTSNILEKGGFNKYFDPEKYAQICHHVRTITKAFKEDDNGTITKTLKDQTVFRGMDYVGLHAMFKNGGYEIPTDRNQFNKNVIDDINKKHPTIFDKAVLSTTMSEQVLSGFDYDKIKLSIFVPKGTKSLDVAKNFNDYHAKFEKELILPPSTKLKVQRCDIDKNSWIVINANVAN